MAEKVVFESARKADADMRQARNPVEDKNVIEEVDKVISAAADAGASEVHLEPVQDGYVIRVREAGTLRKVSDIPERLKLNVANRIKVLAGLDITKSRIPQSGYFKLVHGDKKLELNVYSMPMLYGESIVIKLSYKVSATMRLHQLGMQPAVLATYQKALARGSGLYLITGPPGSGKRTTIYASILEELKPDQLALGFDPVVKYEVPGMVQGKPEEKSEYTFAEAITALIRQEPDIAYIGEISGEADARATIQGAFAKRLVLARMTANDSVSAIQNLIDMGIQPFLIVASLAAVINQRMVRRLCPSCRQPYSADATMEREIGLKLPDGAQFYKPKGCPACQGTGYRGFLAIFELYKPNEELGKMVIAKEPVQNIRSKAFKDATYTLKVDGIMKALGGYASLEDVLNCL
ncbi:MAG: Flp pilus assembly complex ATPase component TadA [Acidobacteria bacterium]|nr:Flp pilus assembly complex ATPase component TadA [Acidobacteriota bacterium]